MPFITNQSEKKLKSRLIQLIRKSKELKFLVGFFYFSGIHELYDTLKNNPDTQLNVLVGLNVDKLVHSLVEYADTAKSLTDNQRAELFLKSVAASINSDDFDTENFYEQIRFFLQLIKQDKLRIRKTYDPNHSKLYIFKFKDEYKDIKEAFFITGSSNLTRAGISEQNEFNVEISDYGEQEAEDYFDELWETAVKITESAEFKRKLIELIAYKSLVTEVTPFEAYALVLKTYLDLQKQKQVRASLYELLEHKGYKRYKYQLDAVAQALTIIERNKGVIIADVVGLGKSIIAGLVARSLNKRGIIICPPSLIGDQNKQSGWKKYIEDFNLFDWDVRSCGLESLRQTAEFLSDKDDFEVVIVDEAHRFRNEDTEAYDILQTICRDRTVLLLTATPFNNTPADIFSLLKLFIIPGKSKITLNDDLYSKFRSYNTAFRQLSNIKKNYNSKDPKKRAKAESDYQVLFGDSIIDLGKVHERSKYLAASIRQVLEPVLVRRNRIDLRKDPEYSKEVYELSDVKDPIESFFALTNEQSDFYDQVIHDYFGEDGEFKGAIYRPFIYEEGLMAAGNNNLTGEQNRERLIQTNLYDFMRRLLVKRFESSFGAFEKSIANFRIVTEKVQKFIEKTGKYILDRDLLEDIYDKDIDDIEQKLLEYQQQLESGSYPKSYKVYKIDEFKSKDEFIAAIGSDHKMFTHILDKIRKLHLVDNDPKLDCLINEIKQIQKKRHNAKEPNRKVIMFSEYVDTVKYLEGPLNKAFPDMVITVKGDLNTAKNKEILENFDTSYKSQQDKYQILLTSDKFSEGVNLNRAGAVINYDIPWNPTRVIQRVGRINRISKKVFDELYIYNFFPTIQGAEYVPSRKIAGEKMFLIHNTLGEDSKIFEVDEEPTAANLFKKIMQNPEEQQAETFQTRIRSLYFDIVQKYPEVINRINELPPRVKTAKESGQNDLVVFIRKGLGFFVRGITNDDDEIDDLLFENAIDLVTCTHDTPMLPLSSTFWANYQKLKETKAGSKIPPGAISLEARALNKVKSLIDNPKPDMAQYNLFLQDLREDILEYKTLSDYMLRQIINIKTAVDLAKIQKSLGSDYLARIKEKLGRLHNEVIIAIENITVAG